MDRKETSEAVWGGWDEPPARLLKGLDLTMVAFSTRPFNGGGGLVPGWILGLFCVQKKNHPHLHYCSTFVQQHGYLNLPLLSYLFGEEYQIQ